MEFSDQKLDALEVILGMNNTMLSIEDMLDEELIDHISLFLPYFKRDDEIESIINSFFKTAKLSFTERGRLEGCYFALFSPYCFNDAGDVVSVVLK